MSAQSIFTRVPVLAGVALALMLATAPVAQAACSDPADLKVDWSGCDKSGADLRFANLINANLTGAILHSANLSGATWADGKVCAEESIGACK